MVQCRFIADNVISYISDMNEVAVNLDIYSKRLKNSIYLHYAYEQYNIPLYST